MALSFDLAWSRQPLPQGAGGALVFRKIPRGRGGLAAMAVGAEAEERGGEGAVKMVFGRYSVQALPPVAGGGGGSWGGERSSVRFEMAAELSSHIPQWVQAALGRMVCERATEGVGAHVQGPSISISTSVSV